MFVVLPRVNSRIFGELPDGSWSNAVTVAGHDIDVIVAALQRVAGRMMTVSRGGIEYSPDDPALDSGRVDTPNCAWVDTGSMRVVLTVDCKDTIGVKRSQVFRRILREELDNCAAAISDVIPDGSTNHAPSSTGLTAAGSATEPYVPESIAYRDADPPGFPFPMASVPGRVVHGDSHYVYSYFVDGSRVWGDWGADVTFATELEVSEFARQLVQIGTDEWRLLSKSNVVDGLGNPVEFHAYQNTSGNLTLKLTGGELRGARGKPPYLRRAREPRGVNVTALQSTPESRPAARWRNV